MTRHRWRFFEQGALFSIVLRRCQRCGLIVAFHVGSDPDEVDLGGDLDDCDAQAGSARES